MTRARLLTCVLALAVCAPWRLLAQPASRGDQAPLQVSENLRRVWRQDPLTAGRPFPAVRVVEAPSGEGCASAPFPASGTLVLACPASNEILVRRGKLAALRGVFGEGAEAFVVAFGLGQILRPPAPPAPSAPPATAGLRAACVAGTFLGALPISEADRRLVLNNALSAGEQAFASSAAPQLGTGPQRAYALLSGMGGTKLDCGAAAMARLASGSENLEAFLATRGTSVGIDVFCRTPPTCPRQVGFGAALP
jgi:hypothetical protein